MDAARGKTDFLMGAPALHFLMSNGKAMFAKVKDAKQLSGNLRAMFNYRIGFYQFGVYEDSGIRKMSDLKGKRVFLGPPAAVQRVVAGGFARAISGLEPGKDYEVVKLGFSPAMQAFPGPPDRRSGGLRQPAVVQLRPGGADQQDPLPRGVRRGLGKARDEEGDGDPGADPRPVRFRCLRPEPGQ